MGKNVVILSIICFAQAGCNNQVESWVNEVKIKPNVPSPTDASISSPMSIKMSPGRLDGKAQGMSVKGNITITNQKFTLGSDASLVLTLNRSRFSQTK
jgi:hypothetical protein